MKNTLLSLCMLLSANTWATGQTTLECHNPRTSMSATVQFLASGEIAQIQVTEKGRTWTTYSAASDPDSKVLKLPLASTDFSRNPFFSTMKELAQPMDRTDRAELLAIVPQFVQVQTPSEIGEYLADDARGIALVTFSSRAKTVGTSLLAGWAGTFSHCRPSR